MDLLYLILDIRLYFILAAVFMIFILKIRNNSKEKSNFPPGPFTIPLIGSSIMLPFTNPAKNGPLFKKWYGDLTLFYAGSSRILTLNTYKALHEAFMTQPTAFQDRGRKLLFTFRRANPHGKGILESDYHDTYRRNRKLSLKIIGHLGVGRSIMESKIMDESERLFQSICGMQGKAFDPSQALTCSVANIISSVILNKQYQHNDPDLLRIIKNLDDTASMTKYTRMIDMFNFLRFIPPFKVCLKVFDVSNEAIKASLWESVMSHLKYYRIGQVCDFVDGWIEKHYDSTNKSLTDDKDNTIYLLRDIFIAGTETVASSLKWTIIQLANHQDTQAKLNEEICHVIPNGRPIYLNDRARLPYLEAFIWEVQRFKSVVPFQAHYTSVDSTLCGYDIPAHTYVFTNTNSIHMDEDSFQQPAEFRPERFIDSHGKFIKHPNVVPFGIGKRSCLGEVLARQELFLITAMLAQRFEFVVPDGCERIEVEGVAGITYMPKPFKVCAIPR